MARDLNHLYLHIAQLRVEGDNALTKKYHTTKIEKIIQENNRLIDHILLTYDEAVINSHIDLFYDLLWFLNNCNSYIVSSTSDDVRSEIFSCLRFVIKEWIPNPQEYVILCSHGEYGYNSFYLNHVDFYAQIESIFGFRYQMKMIPIKMPFHMRGDFMFNAALYHEVGHFIDHYHKFTDSIIEDARNGIIVIPQADVYLVDMAEDIAKGGDAYFLKLTKFIGEYLADLFAVRYTGMSMFEYLRYVNPSGVADREHPSVACREKIAAEFLDIPANYGEFLKMLLSYTKDVKGNTLCPNTLRTDISSFISQAECDKPESSLHAHSIIPALWDIWNNKRGEFKDDHGVQMHFIEIYKKLMELTANTIQKLQ